MKEALKLLRASLPSSIEIRKNITSDALVMGDATQIHQIMMNLCANAAHAMEQKDGRLSIGLEDVQLGPEFTELHPDLVPGNFVKLTVSDTGHGIDPKSLDRIFEPFFTTKEKGEGTGMGLAVVHGIVTNYGGAIELDSKPGAGTTFFIYLPVIEKHIEIENEGEPDIPTGNERILFVDDEISLVKIAKMMLKSLGYRVTACTNGVEALDLFQEQKDAFDLIITDMTMPNMTGDLLAAKIMDIRPDIPIILCTGFSSRMSEDMAAGVGIRELIFKPIVKKDLAIAIRQALDVEKSA